MVTVLREGHGRLGRVGEEEEETEEVGGLWWISVPWAAAEGRRWWRAARTRGRLRFSCGRIMSESVCERERVWVCECVRERVCVRECV
jgi:hypothetical protein